MNLLFSTILIGLFPFSGGVQLQDESLENKVDKLLQEVETLKEKVSQLEGERKSLKEDVEDYRKQVIESARRIFELRQALKNGSHLPSEEKKETPPVKKEAPERKKEIGPEKPIRAKVQFVDRTEGFFLLDKGKEDGIKPGYRFEIVRNVYKAGQENPETKHIGIGEVEKLLGKKEDHAKLLLIEGEILNIRYDDIAIAYRKDKEVTLEKKSEEGWKAPQFKIVGMTNDVYMVSYGGMHGAKASQIIFIYRDRKLIVKLRIDSVEKDYCIAREIQGTKKGPYGPGDAIEIEERKSLVVGRLIHLDKKTGIWIDAGSNDGAKQGMKIAVMRRGKKVGELVLEKVERFWSTAVLSEKTRISDLKLKDYVEEISGEDADTRN